MLTWHNCSCSLKGRNNLVAHSHVPWSIQFRVRDRFARSLLHVFLRLSSGSRASDITVFSSAAEPSLFYWHSSRRCGANKHKKSVFT